MTVSELVDSAQNWEIYEIETDLLQNLTADWQYLQSELMRAVKDDYSITPSHARDLLNDLRCKP